MSKELKKELGDAKAIEVISKMEGGILIQTNLRKDLINFIDKLSNSYKTASHPELIAIASDIKNTLTMIRVFNNAKQNADFLEEELNKILEEESNPS